jgi:D-alanyl-D-alanine carboxypeptidase
MRPTRLLVAVLVVLVAAGGLISAYRFVRADLEGRARVASGIMALYDDLLARHRDLPLAEERARLARFRTYDLIATARGVAGLREDYIGTERRLAEDMGGPRALEEPRYKTFTPNGFRDFANSVVFPRTRPLAALPRITGSEAADERLRRLAESRGYLQRPVALEEGLVTDGRYSLQSDAMEAWKRLREAAERSGIELDLISAYRSPDRQREIFMQRLRQIMLLDTGRELSAAEIAQGKADADADRLLATSSIPGYSRHHTGYVFDLIDVTSGRPSTEFALTRGFAWLSADNYLMAKRFGFIPSYPEGVERQGPDPEAWEYIWVGEQALRVPAVPTL